MSHSSGNHELTLTTALLLAHLPHHAVSLLTDPEIAQLRLQAQPSLVAAGNAEFHHCPSLDRSIPHDPHAF